MSKTNLLLILLSVSIISCGNDRDRETLTQVGTIDALLGGGYDGSLTLGELKRNGDFGIGTFDRLNGEMVVLDGRIYQVTADGKIGNPELSVKTPFAAVTFFDSDRQVTLPAGTNFDSLTKIIDAALPTQNIFYAIRIEGRFHAVKTRSVPAQSRPYKVLKEIAATQPIFDFQDVDGTIVGFRCPSYVAGVNVPGYHLHFISKDGQAGGHLLAFTVEKAVAQIDDTHRLTMILPQDNDFYEADLTVDKQADLKKVEK
ncbi:MAG: acetolactate decarboxylase [Candidatus Neomarinimicrobiota bacterium]